MSSAHRLSYWLSGLVLAMAVVTAWSHGKLQESRDAAAATSRDLSDCRRLAADIRRLRQQPAVASGRELQVAELAQRIERAAVDAGVSPQAIVRIAPESARRLSETPYRERPTRVDLRGVSLRQLVGFLHRLSAAGPDLQARHLRVSAPRTSGASALWNVELTLSQLIYTPMTGSAGRRGDT